MENGHEDTPWREVAALATRQRGVVGRPQLLGLGLTPDRIDHALRRGWLVRVHHAVYAVGHGHLDREGRWMAALLAVGAFAALSHRTAVAAWALLPAADTPIHVVLPGIHGPGRATGVVVHRSRTIDGTDVTTLGPLRVTTPERTLEDLAMLRTTSVRELRRAVEQAEHLGLVRRPLDTTRRPRLRLALDEGPLMTKSELEDRFLALVDASGLPAPQRGVPWGPYLLDFVWPAHRLVVETDGRRHRERDVYQGDRERDRELVAAGWRIVRFTYADVVDDREGTIAMLRRLLAEPSVSSDPHLLRT